MKLLFLGTGSAFTVGCCNYHSNMLLIDEKNEGRLLIDCGSDIRFSLYEIGLSFLDIQNVYISHLHADHVGGLEWLSFTTKFDPKGTKPNLYVSQDIVHDLWNKVLSGGLSSIENVSANLETYFNVFPIVNQKFKWNNIFFYLVKTIHFFSNSILMPSYGLFFTVNRKNVFITTDAKLDRELESNYEKADIIFQDCETAEIKSGVHAHYDELVNLEAHIKRKMWLYHYNPGILPDAKRDGFRGFVKKNQLFDFSHKETD